MSYFTKFRADWRTVFLIGAAVIVVYLTLIPVMTAIYGSLRTGPPGSASGFTLQNYVKALQTPNLYRALWNSLVFAVAGGSVAFVIGCFLAWVTERTNTPLKWLIYASVFTEVMIPGILESISLVLLYSPKIGLANIYLGRLLGLEAPLFDIYSMGGMIWGFASSSFSVPFLLMAAALRSMDPALEEASIISGWGTVGTTFQITLRLALPAMLATWIWLFIRGIETFDQPAIMGLPAGITVLATEVYLATREVPADYNLAATYAMVYLVVALAGLYVYYRATGQSEKFAVITGKGFRPFVIDLGPFRFVTLALAFLTLTVVLYLPLLVTLYASFLPWYGAPSVKMFQLMSLENYRWIVDQELVLRALGNNLLVGGGSATAAVLLTAVVAWIVIRTDLPGRKILDALAFTPIAFPGIVFGLAVMWLYLTLPIPVYGTLWILLIAYTSKYLPICMRACSTALTQVHSELEDASSVSGASWWFTFTRVLVPLILPGMFVGWIYVLTLSFKVLSLPVLLGHAGTEVIPVIIFDLYEGGQYTRLTAVGVVVVVLVSAISILARAVSRRFGLENVQ